MGPSGDSDLQRFVAAQDAGGSYDSAVAELRAGCKRGHWMWFVFPQIEGLGHSEMSRRYAISSLQEARAYLEHPVLGPRLVDCARILAELETRDPVEVLGFTDSLKLRSSMTLFHRAAPEEPAFVAVLERLYGGATDPATDARL
ncbi:MAG: DUF1810 domain-containing protein [Solirubrobacteraceae bacterium]